MSPISLSGDVRQALEMAIRLPQSEHFLMPMFLSDEYSFLTRFRSTICTSVEGTLLCTFQEWEILLTNTTKSTNSTEHRTVQTNRDAEAIGQGSGSMTGVKCSPSAVCAIVDDALYDDLQPSCRRCRVVCSHVWSPMSLPLHAEIFFRVVRRNLFSIHGNIADDDGSYDYIYARIISAILKFMLSDSYFFFAQSSS